MKHQQPLIDEYVNAVYHAYQTGTDLEHKSRARRWVCNSTTTELHTSLRVAY